MTSARAVSNGDVYCCFQKNTHTNQTLEAPMARRWQGGEKAARKLPL
ncbi:hypothetical protein [Acidovorax cavernicola]|nr:hypothetical protein [Acidovorax cavernicola]